jgi:hypothetical protein
LSGQVPCLECKQAILSGRQIEAQGKTVHWRLRLFTAVTSAQFGSQNWADQPSESAARRQINEWRKECIPYCSWC